MLPTAHSPEFARLATRWLDGVASAEEATKFWTCVQQSPECARVFAEMARFELLLESTSAEIAREALVAVAAREKSVVHRRKAIVSQALKIAAVVTLLGMALWSLWPSAKVEEMPVASAPTVRKLQRAGDRERMLIAPTMLRNPTAASPIAAIPAKPLPQHLDEFFLTAVTLDKVPLREAIRLLEDQLRALNFSRSASLDRLRVTLPAEAMAREVTFRSGAISFLKAVRAVAALAGCDVTVSDVGIALNGRMDATRQSAQERAVQSLLAADGMGLHANRNELIEDARALGMIAGDDITAISGTAAQFEALSQLAEARRQVRLMPEIPLMAYVLPAKAADESHVLTLEETKAQALSSANGTPLMIQPSSTTSVPTAGQGPDIVLSAVPAGDGWQISLQPNTVPVATSPLSAVLPIDAIVLPGGGFGVNFPSQLQPTTPTLSTSGPSNQKVAGTTPQQPLIAANAAVSDTSTAGTLVLGAAKTSTGGVMNNAGTLSFDSAAMVNGANLVFTIKPVTPPP